MDIEVVKVWLPCIVSILTLLINLCFYIFIQPSLGYKYKVKEQLYKECAELFVYLTDIVSKTDFNGVPTKIREHSRKSLNTDTDIEEWNTQFRNESSELRKLLGRYCGGLKQKKLWIKL